MTYSQTIKHYYNFTKPGIIYGNLLTASAGFFFANQWHANYSKFFAMLAGTALIIGCGCVLNNVIDRNIDQKMHRTKNRASVTGAIHPKAALIYASVLGVLGSLILGILVNGVALGVALFGLFIYVIVYGFAKRKSVYGTLVGAFAGAVPPLIGYTAVTGYIDQAGVLIVFILICWQLSHFYGIALYRKKEYRAAGIPVWPIVKGDWSAQLQAIGFIALFTLFSISLFFFGYTGFIYLAVMFVVGVGWLWYSVLLAGKMAAAPWGRKIFLSSLVVMIILCLGLAFGPILP